MLSIKLDLSFGLHVTMMVVALVAAGLYVVHQDWAGATWATVAMLQSFQLYRTFIED